MCYDETSLQIDFWNSMTCSGKHYNFHFHYNFVSSLHIWKSSCKNIRIFNFTIIMNHLIIYHISDGFCIRSERESGADAADRESYRTLGHLILVYKL